MAAARPPVTDAQFIDEMAERGVSHGTTEFLLDWLRYAYRAGLTPSPDDKIYSDLHVLGDDASALIIEFFEHYRRKVPANFDGSEVNDPSLAELGRWLESYLND